MLKSTFVHEIHIQYNTNRWDWYNIFEIVLKRFVFFVTDCFYQSLCSLNSYAYLPFVTHRAICECAQFESFTFPLLESFFNLFFLFLICTLHLETLLSIQHFIYHTFHATLHCESFSSWHETHSKKKFHCVHFISQFIDNVIVYIVIKNFRFDLLTLFNQEMFYVIFLKIIFMVAILKLVSK